MAEETDLSRTQPASARRLQEARAAGDVPRSAELSGWIVLLSALGVLAWQAPRLLDALQALAGAAFRHAGQPFAQVVVDAAEAALWSLLPVLGAIFVAALFAPVLLSGWVYAPARARADLSRADPFKPLVRTFSADCLVDGGLALLKLALAVAAVAWVLADGWRELGDLGGRGPGGALDAILGWVGRGLLVLAAAFALAAALDAAWRWWRYLRRHAMTWQEVVAEAREAELHPELRAQLRGRLQQAGQGTSPGRGTIDEVIG